METENGGPSRVGVSRRKFLKKSALAGLGAAIGSATVLSAPSILTRARTAPSTGAGSLRFRPYYVQRGRGPHLLEWAYASDRNWDAFHSDIGVTRDGVTIADTEGKGEFGINVRWNAEEFGYIFLTADNGGDFYRLPEAGKATELNLNYEIARSRVVRNRSRLRRHAADGWKPSPEVRALTDLSEELLEEAGRPGAGQERCASFAQRSLLQALRGGEALEREHAEHAILLRGFRPDFRMGCDARGFYQMHQDLFLERFTQAFNFATITFVQQTNREMEDFEPQEGKHQYAMRDLLLDRLRSRDVAVEGRLLHWFHTWVTPSWLKGKSYDQLLGYVERTTKEVITHYGDRMATWEIVNELHDWANECRLTPDQEVELARLACDVAKASAPRVGRMINHCCPFAEYVQLKQWSGQEALYPQRTPVQFTKALVDAGVDFTIIGQQMYFPYRDLQDSLLLIERYEQFGKRVQISEIGTSAGPTNESVRSGKTKLPAEPYAWHRPWDEELQADWLQGLYTLAYSKPWIEGAHWFDFLDQGAFMDNGGLLRSAAGEPKAAFQRLLKLQQQWKTLPPSKGNGR